MPNLKSLSDAELIAFAESHPRYQVDAMFTEVVLRLRRHLSLCRGGDIGDRDTLPELIDAR